MFEVSPQITKIHQLMSVADLRHRVISQNLANVNTPGYQRLDVTFDDHLAAQSGTGSHAALNMEVTPEEGLEARADGNNVDVDREIGTLNQNALLYQTYTQLLTSQFDMLRRATRGA